MKSWKLTLGVGAACAVCCAVPLLGGAAFVSFVAALWACADELLLPVALLAFTLSVLWLWRRRRATRLAACECASACAAGGDHACR